MEGSVPPPLPSQPPADGQGEPPPLPHAGPTPGPDAPVPADEFQTLNDAQNVDVRVCHSCHGQMMFNIEAQALVCPHCGTSEQISHAEGAEVKERSYKQALAASYGKGNAVHDASGEKEVICSNCNGHTTFVGTLTTVVCPYCATPIQRTDVHDAPDRLAVDGVLPFLVTDAEATERLEAWINKRWFAPDEFKKYGTKGSFQSIYAAYFTYDADATTSYRGERGDDYTRTVGSGDNKRTVTETRWSSANGRVFNKFDDVTVLANTGFQERYVTALDPWPSESIKPFSPDYLAGHLSRTYDRDAEQCFDMAQVIMDQTINQTIRADIGGDDQRIHQKDTRLANVKYKHVLLPIWLLTVLYDGQPWQVFMNGATGEIHGNRPWSQVKIMAAVAAAVVAILVLIVLWSLVK